MKWLLVFAFLCGCVSDKDMQEARDKYDKRRHANYEIDMKICHDLCAPGSVLKFSYSTYDKDPECECLHPIVTTAVLPDGGSVGIRVETPATNFIVSPH